MSSGIPSPSGVSAGSFNATLGRNAGNDTESLSTFASATALPTLSSFTSNSTIAEALPTPSLATTAPSKASTTISTTAAPVRGSLVKASSTSSSSSVPATSSILSSAIVMSSSSSAPARSSTTAKAAASPSLSTKPTAPAASSATETLSSRTPSTEASATPSSTLSSRAATSSLPSARSSASSSSAEHAGAQAPASSSSAVGTATSSAAGTVNSSSAGEKSGPLSAASSPVSSFPAFTPASSSSSIVHSTENSNKPLSSGSSTITPGPSQAKSAPNIIDVPGSTSISTVTEAPQTTFATPVSIAVTASDGHTTLYAPPLVTSVLPSTRTDGMVVQVTHVIANPNSNLNALNHHSFFDNAGAVAGTFIAVGIVATALAAFLLCFVRRRRRRARRARLESRLPTFPFHDDSAAPQTAERRSISVIPMNMDGDPFAEPTRPFRSVGSADGHSAESEGRRYAYEGPFADYRSPEHGAFGHHDAVAVRAPSRAVSTPSIYPPSLPDDGRDHDSLYDQEMHISPPLRAYPVTSVPEYIPLQRRNSTRPSTQESNQLHDLDAHHPPLLARPGLMTSTSNYGYASSSTDHGSSDAPLTPQSDSATMVGSLLFGDEKERVRTTSQLQRPASPPSAFLRRQLSKPLAEAFSIPAELRRTSLIANDPQDYVVR